MYFTIARMSFLKISNIVFICRFFLPAVYYAVFAVDHSQRRRQKYIVILPHMVLRKHIKNNSRQVLPAGRETISGFYYGLC